MHTETTRRSCLGPEKKGTEGKGNPACYVSGGPLWVLTLGHLLTVSRSQEEVARRTGTGGTAPKRPEVNRTLHSLTQLVLLPDLTLKPHKAFIALSQKD